MRKSARQRPGASGLLLAALLGAGCPAAPPPDVSDEAVAPDAGAESDGRIEVSQVDAAPPDPCTARAASVAAIAAALADPAPGTTLCIADGTYRDAQLDFLAPGTAARPIVITAEHPGRAIFTGKTRISMGGAFVTLRGLSLQGGQSADDSLIELRSGGAPCDDCRVTELAIVDFDKGNKSETKWLSLYGLRDRVDHCAFYGKSNLGTLLVLWRAAPRADYAQIDHNLFSTRPPRTANGNEAIRIGTSTEAESDSRSTIEENLFEDMSGDAEIISVKAGGNLLRRNTFRRCRGQLTLRHGAGSTVDGNIFLTEGDPEAGGIRVIGARHRVINNYIEGVRSGAVARGGIVLVSGQVDPKDVGYAQVQDALIAFNTIVDSEQSLMFGADTNTLAPADVTLANNLIAGARGSVVAVGTGLLRPRIAGNLYGGAPLGFSPATGFREVDPRLARGADGLLRPGAGSPALGAADALASVPEDLDGQARAGALDVGCDQAGGAGPPRRPLARGDVGPQSWRVALP